MSAFLRAALLLLFFLAAPLQAARIALYGESSMAMVTAILDRLGLPYERIPEGNLASRDPGQSDLLFLAHDAADDPEEVAWIEQFLDAGGKVFSFYTLPPILQLRLGVLVGDYLRPASPTFAQIRLQGQIPHLPAVVRQHSWNIHRAFPAADSVQVLGIWSDPQGRDTPHAALLLSPRGAHLTHVLLDHDPEGATRLYAGLLGHFFPDLWPAAVRGALAKAEEVAGPLDSLAELKPAALVRQQALSLLAQGNYSAALEAALQARTLAVRVYARSQSSRSGEFRGVWLHSPYGVADWGWEKTCKVLAQGGFNALVANMLDAGRTSFPSAILPEDPRAQREGDQLRQAVTAAHRHGLAFHAWKVNYNLSTADSALIDALRREGRLQRSDQGEEILWLCPSHPANLELEVASMLEVVRNYPVDGLHFDYIRYPSSEGCYCDGCRLRFEEQTGHSVSAWPEEVITGELAEAFQEWRRAQITQLVRAVSIQARRIRPEIEISAAVFSDWPQTRISIGQDWIDWIEAGYLDFVCPMDYIPDQEAFRRTVQRQVEWVNGRVPLYIGIGAFLLPSADELIRQIAWTRQAGADGFVLFQYDARFGEEVLPLLQQGLTRQKTYPPHPGPAVSFAVSGRSIEGIEPGSRFYSLADTLQLEVQLVEGIQARAAQGELTLRTLDDRPRFFPGRLAAGPSGRLTTFLVLSSGDYRPVVEGKYRDAEGRWRPFVHRGPLLHVRGPLFLDSLAALSGPPSLKGEGVPVGILVDGYGGGALLQALSGLQKIEVFPVQRLTPAVLAATRVLVIPQPRQRSAFDRRQRQVLREWVAAGGRLLVTHDMAGLRGLLPVIPEVCHRGTGFPRSTQWQIAFEHPAVLGVEPGLHPHSYYDHVTLEPGRDGLVLAVDEEHRPVLVVGPHGQGWYAALGLVPGLAPDDREVVPQGAERQLVESLVKWLAEEL